MKMGPITIGIGVLLILLGVGFYFAMPTPTALIPSGFGLVLAILGALAGNEKMRMHVMHVAVLIGLVGVLMPGYMSVKGLLAEEIERPYAVAEQGIMAIICLVFVALCVKSFIDARKARKQQESVGA